MTNMYVPRLSRGEKNGEMAHLVFIRQTIFFLVSYEPIENSYKAIHRKLNPYSKN